MKSRILSRGPEIDTDKCVENAGANKYNLILAASERAREIRRQHKESDKFEHVHPNVTALLEIQNGEIDVREYLSKLRKRG